MLSNAGQGRRAGLLRGGVIVGLLLSWLTLAGLGGTSIGRLSEVQENDAASFLPESAESTYAAELAQGFVASTTLPALVIVESRGATLGPQQLAQVREYADGVASLALSDRRELSEILLEPVVVVPSEDGAAALVSVALDAGVVDERIGGRSVVDEVVAGLRTSAGETFGEDVDVWVTGPAGFVADLVAAFGGIDSLLLLVALIVVFVILVLVYRSPSLPFTVLLTALFGLAAAALVVYQLARAEVLVLNGQSQGILFILVVGAATDYSLLIVARYREELRQVAAPPVAMRRALRASLEPIAASAGTVIAGLLCLLLSDLSSNASLGPVAAIGIVAALLAATTLLPALLLMTGRFARLVFWPRVPRMVVADGIGEAETVEELEARSGLWGRVSALIGRHPRRMWTITALALVAAAAWLPTLRASGTGDTDVFLTEVESVAGEEVLDAHFDAGQVQPITVIAQEADLDTVLQAVEGVAGVTAAQVVAQSNGSPSDAAGPPMVVDGRIRVDVVSDVSAESREATDVVQRVRDAVHEVAEGAVVGGAAAERLDTQLTSARDLRVIVPTVLAVIFLVLMALLRSVVAAVLIVAANLLSFGATLGIGALVFNHVLGFPGADATVPLYAFVFLVALGVDYSIFLMTRVREESLVHGTRAGVRRGLAVTGAVITSAGLVLAATFGALAVLPLLFLVQIAFLVGVGVLVDTFVVRTLLVPGLVHDIGRATWWPWQHRVPA